MLRRECGTIVAVLAAVVGAGGVLASASAQMVSPLIAPARVQVEQPLGQGDIVQLPPLAVTNQGSETAQMRMDVVAGDDAESEVVPEWVRLSPVSFMLEPGAGTVIDVWLEVPSDAQPGPYHARLRAAVEPGDTGTQTAIAVQAAVATDLRFTVEERNVTTQDRIESWWSRYGIGAMLATGVGTVTFLFLHVANRFEIRRRNG